MEAGSELGSLMMRSLVCLFVRLTNSLLGYFCWGRTLKDENQRPFQNNTDRFTATVSRLTHWKNKSTLWMHSKWILCDDTASWSVSEPWAVPKPDRLLGLQLNADISNHSDMYDQSHLHFALCLKSPRRLTPTSPPDTLFHLLSVSSRFTGCIFLIVTRFNDSMND